MRELVNAQTTPPFDRLFLLLVGPEGVGKSWLSCTGRPSTFFFDFDGKLKGLAGKPNVYGVSYRDPNKPSIQPSAISDALADLSKIELDRSLSKFGFQLAPGQEDKIKTVVVDSTYTLGKACRDYALYSTSDIARTINVPNMQVRVPNSFDGWNAEMAMVESFVLRCMAIPDVDVIVTVHETQAKDPLTSTPGQVRRSSKVSIFPERHNGIVKYFNEIWRMSRVADGAPLIKFVPDPNFVSRSNLDTAALTAGGPNIAAMIREHQRRHPALALPAAK